uniref:Uncharacterized protein n=1 Tax=Ditylenchus dipsaci TaxID=166011 RepID=A0A915DLB3_9BILA
MIKTKQQDQQADSKTGQQDRLTVIMPVLLVLKLLLSSCLFLTFVVPNVNSNGTPLFSIAGRLFLGGLLHNDDHVAFKAKPEDTSKYEKYFTQKLDHFKKNSATFQQRFFVNAQYSTNNSIYFLLVEGDNVASSSRVSNLDYPHMISAKDAGATVYNLEHRFYGSSQPFKTMSAKNMTFLTSQQALEDISNFIRTQNQLSGDKNPKWILFGGGYGGSLVVWHRQKYPGLSTGVISSGATVIASGDYYAFQLNVENSYKEADKNCFNGINNAINRLKQLVQYEEGRDILNKKLNLQPPFSSKSLPKYRDLQNFFHNIAVLLQIPVQNNKVNAGVFATEVGIDNICKIFNSTAIENLDKVAQMAKFVITQLNGTYTGVSNSYHDTVAYLKNETFDVNQSRAATRAWFWQNCNEFGYFTSTDNSGLAFGSTIPNNFFINLCVDVFGHHHGIMNVLKVVKNTQDSYGREKKFNQTNAVITRGSVDPWKSLGVESVSDKTAIAYLVNGGAHCAEFQPPKSDDSYGVKMARNLIKTRITRWLSARTKKTMEKVAELKERTQKNFSKRREIVNWDAKIEWNITLPEESALLSAPPGKDRPILADFIGQTSANRHLKRQKEENAFAAKSAGVKPFYFLGYVLQDLDHFNSSNNLAKKWRQLFVSNNAHKKKDGPIFLMWARQFGASVYALEHRYYGYSTPFTNLTVQNLTYLTSEQALGDIAVFIKAINKEHNKTEAEQKWILFGGAYAGSLVAWFRLKYPELSTGAVASSAPVQAKTDFFEYLFVVQNSTKNFGGKTCAKNVHEFFAWDKAA